MFMRFRGGGVGHKSFQGRIKRFCDDRWPDEKEVTSQQVELEPSELAGMPVDITESESEDVPKNEPIQPGNCDVDIELPDLNVDEGSENGASEPESDLEGELQSDDESDGNQESESEAEVDEGEQVTWGIQPESEIHDELDDDELEYADF